MRVGEENVLFVFACVGNGNVPRWFKKVSRFCFAPLSRFNGSARGTHLIFVYNWRSMGSTQGSISTSFIAAKVVEVRELDCHLEVETEKTNISGCWCRGCVGRKQSPTPWLSVFSLLSLGYWVKLWFVAQRWGQGLEVKHSTPAGGICSCGHRFSFPFFWMKGAEVCYPVGTVWFQSSS